MALPADDKKPAAPDDRKADAPQARTMAAPQQEIVEEDPGPMGAQVVLDPASDASKAARGVLHDNIIDNTVARDEALAEEDPAPAPQAKP